jgi:hypothetical protein
MRLSFLFMVFAAVTSAAEPLHLSGEVLIQNNGPRTVIAYVQTGPRVISHVLRVTAEEPFPQNPVSFHFQRAEITVEPDQIVIRNADGDISVIFAVTRARDDAHNLVVLSGYWLSQNVVGGDRTITSIRRARDIAAEWCDASVSGDDCLFDNDGGSGGTTCSSGGPGSTSCSCSHGGTSCTVTCGSGYYACCKNCYIVNGQSCKCVRN